MALLSRECVKVHGRHLSIDASVLILAALSNLTAFVVDERGVEQSDPLSSRTSQLSTQNFQTKLRLHA